MCWSGEAGRILGSFDYKPNPQNPSLAIRAGGSNKGDSSESDLAEFESITRQSCFNFQAILNLSLSNALRRKGLEGWEENASI